MTVRNADIFGWSFDLSTVETNATRSILSLCLINSVLTCTIHAVKEFLWLVLDDRVLR
jgi:hypothetical protein